MRLSPCVASSLFYSPQAPPAPPPNDLSSPRSHQISPSEIGSVGALDLGGASTQITTPRGDTDAAPPHRGTSDISAPLPRQGEGAAASGGGGVLPPGVVAVALPGRRGRREALVFSHSHLGFGNKQVRSVAVNWVRVGARLEAGTPRLV